MVTSRNQRENSEKAHTKHQSEFKLQDTEIELPNAHLAHIVQRARQDPNYLSPRDVLQLQRSLGNRAVEQLLGAEKPKESDDRAFPSIHHSVSVGSFTDEHSSGIHRLPPTLVEDEGKTGTALAEGEPVEMDEAKTASLETGEVNEWDEMEGTLVSDIHPHAFVNNGRTGRGIVHWGGGNGGMGNQSVGEISVSAPHYESEDAADAGPEHATAWAWIRPGTGTATVTRSYRGVRIGANGANYYFTARAAARADVHEELHVNSSQSIHNTNIVPLEQRIALHTGRDNALKQGNTPAVAIAALRGIIDWNTALTSFRTADRTANTPMGTVDTTDMARADFVRDYGARTVDGTNYAHYIDVSPGPGSP